MALHQQCTALGGKFVWVFDVPFTHYICQVSFFISEIRTIVVGFCFSREN
jgi:hypothetical protein